MPFRRQDLCTVIVCSLLTSLSLRAQSPENRFELGLRLRAFEQTLEKTKPEDRKEAILALKPITFTFFSGQIGRAGMMLDEARLTLQKAKNRDTQLWASSLSFRPASRLLGTSAPSLSCTIEAFYPVKQGRPEKVQARLTLVDADQKPVAGAVTENLDKLPQKMTIPMKEVPEGDYTLVGEVLEGDQVLSRREQTLSVARDLEKRLEQLTEAIRKLPEEPAAIERASVRRLAEILTDLQQKKTLETSYPAARLLREAEEVVKAVQTGKPYYGQKKPGEHWLVLPTMRGTTARLQAPAAVKTGKPLPLVIALHGAGGSENMFFDVYGAGKIARLCAQRGWLLVAPRNGSSAGLVDEIDRLYPVDRKRIILIGHSMGAGQAVQLASLYPEKYAAVAALGGGGQIRASEKIKALPFFIGIGTEDFALSSARALNRSLGKAGVKTLEYREYPGMEHLVIVQLALEDVFTFFTRQTR